MKRAWLGFVLSLLLLCTHNAIAQRGTSQIDTITIQANGSTIGTATAPFRINFPGCTGSRPGGVFTISCSSVMVYPGAGIANSTGSAWGPSYGVSNAVPSNFLPPAIVYNNQSNTYSPGSTQKVQSNSSAAGFQDAGSAIDPPTSSSTVGSKWWDTDKLYWNYVSGWTDNASTPNYLYAAIRSSQDDDQQNLWGFQYVSTLLAKIESGTNVYVPIAVVGDSETSGFGVTQKSFVYPLVTALQSPASGWGNAGEGFVTSQAVSSGKNPLPSGVTGSNSGTWTYCSWGDGTVSNGHSGQCWGPDNTDATASVSGAYQSYTGIFTDCYTYWAVQPSGATVLTIVDGSTLVTTSTAGSLGGVVSQHCGTLTEASHTLKAQLSTSATATFLGAVLIDTTQGGGVLVLKMAAAANKAADFAGNPIYETVLAQIQADLVSSLGVGVASYIQMWGANEFNQNIPPATMLGSIATLSTAMHTASPLADIAVMSDPDDGAPAFPNGSNTLTMWQYDKAINSYANKNRYPFISFLRHTYPEASNSSSNRGCYASDNIHLAPACQQRMANLVLDRMTPSGTINRTKVAGGNGGYSWNVGAHSGDYTILGTGGTYGSGDFACQNNIGNIVKESSVGGGTFTLPASGLNPPTGCYIQILNANAGTLTLAAGSGSTIAPATGNTFALYEGAFVWWDGSTYRWAPWRIPVAATSPNSTISVGGTALAPTYDTADAVIDRIVYKTAQSVTMSTSGTVNIGSVAMVTPAADGNYRLSATISTTTPGSGGTCAAGGLALRVGYTDRDTGAAAGSAVGTSNLPIMNVTNATSTASATISSSAAVFRATEIPIGAKSGVAITLYWDEGTASNCTTPPVVEIRPRLEYLGN